MQSHPLIPVSEPLLGGNEAAYLQDCVSSGWISSEGTYLRAFEEKWASYCGMRHGVAVSNGTTALKVAVEALDLPPGSEIIIPSFTIISCATAILEADCVPVVVDVDATTWGIDPDLAEAQITPRTRAIMPVHMFGHPADMQRLRAIAARHNLVVIEDAAEAHGAQIGEQRAGSFGDLSCFSFYANKIITCGEGGMVLTNDVDLAARVRSLRNLCFQPDRRFYHTALGYNFRMTNMQAAVGLAQLERIDVHITLKREMARAYAERLADLAQLRLPVELAGYRNVYWMYAVVLTDAVAFDAFEFASRLAKLGVQTRPLFLGMHEQPALQGRMRTDKALPVTENLHRRGLYLPSGLTLTHDQIDRVCSAVRSALQ